MLIIGLTGSIASGKSTIADVFRRKHISVFDSDKSVHDLMAPKRAAVATILSHFKECGSEKTGIDRVKLGQMVFQDKDKLKQLESILHPLVFKQREQFLQQQQHLYAKAVILDVPLLFETKTDTLCDVTMMAWAPLFLIKQRALRRPHMTDEKLQSILKSQMSMHEKAKLADEKIATGLGHGYMMAKINRLCSKWHLQ